MNKNHNPAGKPFRPTRVLEVEITEGLQDRADHVGYNDALILVRCYGVPVGQVRVCCHDGTLAADDIRFAIENDWQIGDRISRETLSRWLLQNTSAADAALPSWSLVICTRDRVDNLSRCLDSLARLDPLPGGEIIIVDNHPPNDDTKKLASRYPVRYVVEPRQGLNWARSCGARAATGDIIVFTDDDVVVDRLWIKSILQPFGNPRVGAVAGMTLAAEIETEAQELFEHYGGHGRGFYRRVFDPVYISPANAGQIGMGANMAFRRKIVLQQKLFDHECDMGTVTLTGGDTYAFYLVLTAGFQIVYTPEALIWHYHRRDYAAVVRMLYGYSVGGFACLLRMFCRHRDPYALKVALLWLKSHHVRELSKSLLRRPWSLPLDILIHEWRGVFRSPIAYWQACGIERSRRPAAGEKEI